MAQYQVGSQVYDIPDNTPPQQVQQILSQLASQQSKPAQTAEAPQKDTSFSSAFMSGIDRPLENIGTTLQATGLAPNVGQALRDATDAPTNYESASDRFINPEEGDFTIGGFAPEYLPRAVVEQAGNLGGSLISRGAGAATGGLVAGPAGAVGGALAGPALFEFAQQLGPVAIERAKNNGRSEPTWDDWTAAASTAGVSGALNAIGVGGGKGASLLNKTLREGVTESAQSVTEQTGTTAGTDKGLTIDPKQAVGEGIIGGTTAGGFDVAGRTITAPGKLIADPKPEDQQAATGFANDLDRVANDEGYNLKDVDTGSSQGARAAIDTLHVEYASQIDQNIKDLKERLNITDDDSRAEAFEKVKANAAKRKAKNKVKNRVDQSDLDVIEKLAGDTQEGSELLALMRKSNELSALANQSVKGGLSQFTDVFNPLDTDGRYNVGRAIAAPVSGLGAITSGGASLIPAAVGRGVDAVTGRRSRVARYVKQNRGQGGVKGNANLPSLRVASQAKKAADEQAKIQQEALAAARQANFAKQAAQRNEPPKMGENPSPQGEMQQNTGLNRSQVASALRVLERTRPDLVEAVKSYRDNFKTGNQVADLGPLISAVRGLRQNRPELFGIDTTQTAESNAQPSQVQMTDAQRQTGIDGNMKALDEIAEVATKDKQLSKLDKARVKQAVAEMRDSLGVDPVLRVTEIIERAVANANDPAKVRTYLTKYLMRVKRQQRSSQFVSQRKSKVAN